MQQTWWQIVATPYTGFRLLPKRLTLNQIQDICLNQIQAGYFIDKIQDIRKSLCIQITDDMRSDPIFGEKAIFVFCRHWTHIVCLLLVC